MELRHSVAAPDRIIVNAICVSLTHRDMKHGKFKQIISAKISAQFNLFLNNRQVSKITQEWHTVANRHAHRVVFNLFGPLSKTFLARHPIWKIEDLFLLFIYFGAIYIFLKNPKKSAGGCAEDPVYTQERMNIENWILFISLLIYIKTDVLFNFWSILRLQIAQSVYSLNCSLWLRWLTNMTHMSHNTENQSMNWLLLTEIVAFLGIRPITILLRKNKIPNQLYPDFQKNMKI